MTAATRPAAPAALFAALAGRWRVVRAIRHDDGTRARFEGEAAWTPEGGGLRCVEAGRLRAGGPAMEARRETLWSLEDGAVAVRFADGRPFHRMDLGGATAVHDCAPDRYALRYDLSAWPLWSVRWRVDGPRKGYRALTRHAPLP